MYNLGKPKVIGRLEANKENPVPWLPLEDKFREEKKAYWYDPEQRKFVTIYVKLGPKLARGNLKTIYYAKASFPPEENEWEWFAVKKFIIGKPSPEYYSGHIGVEPEEEIAEDYLWERSSRFSGRIIKSYKAAQEMGLKVPPFYDVIMGEDSWLLIQTLMFDKDCIALSDKGELSNLEHFGIKKITNLDSLRKLAETLYEQAMIAAKSGYHLASDAYFILYHPSNRLLDVVIGDFDTFHKTTRREENFGMARKRLRDFAKSNVDESIVSNFLQEIDALFEKYQKAYKKSESPVAKLKKKILG